MGGRVVFLIMMAVIVGGMTLAAITLFNSGRHFQENLGDKSSEWDLSHTEAQRGDFRLGRVGYISPDMLDVTGGEVTCADGESINIVIDIVVVSSQTPSQCDIFLDGRLFKEVDMDKYSCYGCSSDEETVISFATEEVDESESHNVEVCCDGFCTGKEIPPECP